MIRKKRTRKNPTDRPLYPLLFSTNINEDLFSARDLPKNFEIGYYYVIITYLDFDYFDDSQGKILMSPSTEKVKEILKFEEEKEALNYIKKWWSKQ